MTRLFFIESDYRGQRFFEERATERMGREQTIADIVDGQFGNVVRVIVVDEGRALDVTKEMIAECAGLLRAERDGYISRSEYEELTERVHELEGELA